MISEYDFNQIYNKEPGDVFVRFRLLFRHLILCNTHTTHRDTLENWTAKPKRNIRVVIVSSVWVDVDVFDVIVVASPAFASYTLSSASHFHCEKFLILPTFVCLPSLFCFVCICVSIRVQINVISAFYSMHFILWSSIFFSLFLYLYCDYNFFFG